MVAVKGRPDHRRVEKYHAQGDETIVLAQVPVAVIAMPGFQRERYKRHIEKIAAEYDATAFAFPIVALFRDDHIGIDGQQRIAAAEKLGHENTTVLLIQGITSEARLADVYLKINRDRKLLNALEKYIGAVASKDRGTLEVKRLTEEAGFELGKSAAANGKLPAGAAIEIYDNGGPDLYQRVLYVRVCSWGHDSSREANEAKTLKGIAQFLRRYWDKVDDDTLIALLAKQHPGYILQALDKKRGINQQVSYSDYLREQYNKARRGKGGRL